MIGSNRIVATASAALLLCAVWASTTTATRVRRSAGLSSAGSNRPVVLVQTAPTLWTLSNGYVSATLSASGPVVGLVDVRADHTGVGSFAASPVLTPRGGASGIAIEVLPVLGAPLTSSQWSEDRGASPALYVISTSADLAVVRLAGLSVGGSNGSPRVDGDLVLSLRRGERSIVANCSLRVATPGNANAVRVGLYFAPPAVVALYADGVLQGAREAAPYFASDAPLQRIYSVGVGAGSADLSDLRVTPTASGGTRTVLSAPLQGGGGRGVAVELAGGFNASEVALNAWRSGWLDNGVAVVTNSTVAGGLSWTVTAMLAFNDLPFPASRLSPADDSDPLVFDFLAAVYGTSVSALVSKEHSPLGMMAACIAHPERCYPDTWNYFDPDAYFEVAALVHAGDDLLDAEARKILLTAAAMQCNATLVQAGVCLPGQLGHHFINGKYCTPEPHSYCTCLYPEGNRYAVPLMCATYQSLTYTTMLGPNVFWSLAVLEYSAATGDAATLQALLPKLRSAVGFVLGFLDTDYALINAPASLWIDTFVRKNFTADSNAGVVMLLSEMANAERALGNVTGAAAYSSLAQAVSDSMILYLWRRDHFVTSARPATSGREVFKYRSAASLAAATAASARPSPTTLTSGKDFVDFDANLLAVAAGVPDLTQSEAVLSRVSQHPCAYAQPTWVSEVPYGPGDTYLNNTGDSNVAMGRIAWADALARRRVESLGGNATVSRVVDPLVSYFRDNLWMPERFGCDAQPRHNMMYPEYPNVIAVLIKEIAIGVRVRLGEISIQPPPGKARPVVWRVGRHHVEMRDDYVAVHGFRHVGLGMNHVTVTAGPVAAGTWQVEGDTRAYEVDASGLLSVNVTGGSAQRAFDFRARRVPQQPAAANRRSLPRGT